MSIFPPRDEAIIKAIAGEVVAKTRLPLSRQSLADLTTRAHSALGKPVSRSTVWRVLDGDAIKPWRSEHWLFPGDPKFAEKAGPILDLDAGTWEVQPLGPKDHLISSDEKTSIQARIRCHPGLAPAHRQGEAGRARITTVAGRCSTWPPGTCGGDTLWADVSRRPASSRSGGWWPR